MKTEVLDDGSHLVEKGLIKAHLLAGIFFMLTAMTGGLFISFQFFNHYPFDGISWLSFGRVRLVHTNEIAYGFIFNGFLGLLYYAVPRLTGKKVFNASMGWFIFLVWQFTVLSGTVGQLLRKGQGVEWGETPTGFEPGTFNWNWIPVDAFIALGAVLVAIQFFTPIVRSIHKRMYVSLWYISAALVWTILTYLMGNILPEWVLSGSSGAATAGLYIHDLVGLFITPMGWGLMYFFVPIILRKPVWSHALSIIGFWSLAFFYPLSGVHHFLLSSIPMSVQYGAIITTIAVEVVVTTVVVNFFATMWGNRQALRILPIKWFYTGMVFYFITCLQCAFHVTIKFQQIIHFTDWVPGHAHLVMLGVFSFWILGAITWLWPRLTGNEWHSRRMNNWHYWLTLVGLSIMFLDLTAAGLIQGFMQRDLAPWMDIVRALKPYWIIRTVAGSLIVLGQVVFATNIVLTLFSRKPYDYRVDIAEGEA